VVRITGEARVTPEHRRRPGLHRTDPPGQRRWVDDGGAAVTDTDLLDRLARLAIPPAWRGVWASLEPTASVQATGVDARGRIQYRYSAQARAAHEADKFAHLVLLAEALPRIRDHVSADLAGAAATTQDPPARPAVLAALVRLLDRGFFRVGNDRYARDNHTYGLTTLRRDQVRVDGSRLHFDYVAKHHRHRITDVDDADVVPVVRALLDRPGADDDDDPVFAVPGHTHVDASTAVTGGTGLVHVTSAVLNAHLHDLGGAPATAKAFRTWSGTVVAAAVLAGAVLDPPTARQASTGSAAAVSAAANLLGNTPAVAKASYIHPAVLDATSPRAGAARGEIGDAVDRAAARLGTRSVARVWLDVDVQQAVHSLLRSNDAHGGAGDDR
jgi:DNA topoisomerase-1